MTYFEISFLTDVTNKSSELNIHRIYFKENHVVILINVIVQVSQVDITDINNKCITDINDILNNKPQVFTSQYTTIHDLCNNHEKRLQRTVWQRHIRDFYCFM